MPLISAIAFNSCDDSPKSFNEFYAMNKKYFFYNCLFLVFQYDCFLDVCYFKADS